MSETCERAAGEAHLVAKGVGRAIPARVEDLAAPRWKAFDVRDPGLRVVTVGDGDKVELSGLRVGKGISSVSSAPRFSNDSPVQSLQVST